ncbi:hypothetical protein PR202_ga06783 [Eleusine coracana subsp. coracana]|uniref:Uncharacterized protein n=1 Tax=Eleusine coracana subsp. coracana TaxID=191504 RepID=A0AAV5BY41_ELECO|nr:hypothetical protein PR202_ga06783 [Eleusine coracana subsp. coracana]
MESARVPPPPATRSVPLVGARPAPPPTGKRPAVAGSTGTRGDGLGLGRNGGAPRRPRSPSRSAAAPRDISGGPHPPLVPATKKRRTSSSIVCRTPTRPPPCCVRPPHNLHVASSVGGDHVLRRWRMTEVPVAASSLA